MSKTPDNTIGTFYTKEPIVALEAQFKDLLISQPLQKLVELNTIALRQKNFLAGFAIIAEVKKRIDAGGDQAEEAKQAMAEMAKGI